MSTCPICLEENNNSSKKLKCGCNNFFHINCIKTLKDSNINNCPICRREIFKDKTYSNYINMFLNLFFILCLIFSFFFSFSPMKRRRRV